MRIWHILFSHITFAKKVKMRSKIAFRKEYNVLLECIRVTREQANVTQSQLAQQLGIDQTVISKMETGERRIDFIELRNICNALNIDLQLFITIFEAKLQKRSKE
jgi:transcriptional regulator with XRE-family HTH domain